MTVAEMLGRISSRELSEWMAFYELEPFGDERADLRSGIVASTIANVNRAKGGKEYSFRDFMPKFEGGEGGKEPKSASVLQKKWEAVVAAFAKKGDGEPKRR